MHKVLGREAVQHYREQGYVIPEYRLPESLLGELRVAIERILVQYTDVAPEDLANPHMIPPSEGPLSNPFMKAARHPQVLDMVERILGPDLILWITRILCKPPREGREVPWHQDGEYWPIRPLNTCSVWLAIDPATPQNGCMRFIPGSQRRQQLYRHHIAERDNLVLNLEVDQDQFDESKAVNVELQPGQMSLHDVRMIHGSLANRSEQRRAALIMRYMSARSHYDRDLMARLRRSKSPFDIAYQPLWLMRGSDVCGKNDFEFGHRRWRERYAQGLRQAG